MKGKELRGAVQGEGEVYLPGGGRIAGVEELGDGDYRLIPHDHQAELASNEIADLEARLRELREGRQVVSITPPTGNGNVEGQGE